MTDIILCGCSGKMGAAVKAAVASRDDLRIVAGVDLTAKDESFPVYSSPLDVKEEAQVLIDFSHPSALDGILELCKEREGLSAILCTTGYSPEQVEKLKSASKTVPVFYSRNMSLGVNLLIGLAQKAEEILGDSFDVEIVEAHHNQKIDAPSGTALMIADAVNKVRDYKMKYTYDRHSQRKKREKSEIGIHSVRGGTIVGEHEVIFAGKDEVLKIIHSAYSKELFATGAVNAAAFMDGKASGLYDMADLL